MPKERILLALPQDSPSQTPLAKHLLASSYELLVVLLDNSNEGRSGHLSIERVYGALLLAKRVEELQ